MAGTSDPGGPTPVTQPGVVPARAFDHVGLSVPDLDAAVAFFVQGLGARLQFRMDRPTDDAVMGAERLGIAPHVQFALAMLELGGSRIELLQWWPARGQTAPPDADLAGGSHVAVDVADVAAALEVLRSFEGVEVIGEPVTFASGATPGLTNAFVRTPWGALIELVTWQGTGQ